MKTQIIQFSTYILFIALSLTGACKKDFTDPGGAPEDQVFTTSRGLTAVAIGVQRVYTAGRASPLFNTVTANGFVTNELFLVNPGNIPELQLYTGGGTVDGTNTIVAGLWTNSNKIIYDGDRVITNAANLNDKNYASGLIGYTTIFKALSLGNLAMFWEKIPSGIGEQVTFADRAEGFNKAIAAIDLALAAINANAISPAFLSNIPPGIDIVNTLHALKARYTLYIGNNALALTEANSVDLTKRSVFSFDATTQNPIFESATSTNNVFQPVDSTLGLPVPIRPDLADRRVPFYTSINALIAPRFRINGFASTLSTPFPIYLPGEMTLIKAEAYARQSDLANALIELNKVVTKVPATDPFGVGAGLPPLLGPFTPAQLLEQIYKHRSIELFMSGLKLEDMRRFSRLLSERKRNFLPYPFLERDNNPNTPPDPAF